MRIIKFRGKSEYDNEWVYGFGVGVDIFTNEIFLQTKIDNYEFVKEETVGQFTGLYDCEGNEIYEGDNTNLGKVSFHKGGFIVGDINDYNNWHTLQYGEYKGIKIIND